jgi:hypothetical protein
MIATDGRPTIANDPNLNKLMAIAAESQVKKKTRVIDITPVAKKPCACRAA